MHEYLRAMRPLASPDEGLLHRWLSGWAIPDIGTGEEFAGWLRTAGFGDVHVDDITAQMQPSLKRLYRMSQALWPFALGLRAFRLRSAIQHGNISSALDQYRALRRSLWTYGALTATKL